MIIANDVRLVRNVLHADQRRVVAHLAQGVDDVLAVVV